MWICVRLLRRKTGPVFSLFWQRGEPASFWLLCDGALRYEENRGHPGLRGETRPEPSVPVENGLINTTGMPGVDLVREREDGRHTGICDGGAADVLVLKKGFHLFHVVVI